MKNLTLFLAVLLMSINLFGQEDVDFKKHKFGMGLGLSSPIGDFADNNVNNSDAGFAKAGFGYRIYYNYNFSKYLGLEIAFTDAYNGFDGDAISRAYSDNDMYWSVSANSWNHIGIMSGLCINVPIDKLTVNFKLLGGLILSNSPEIYYSVQADNFYYSQTSYSDFSVGNVANIGVGFSYTFDNGFGLSYLTDFNFAQAEYSVYSEGTDGTDVYYDTYDYKQKMNTIMLTFGFYRTF